MVCSPRNRERYKSLGQISLYNFLHENPIKLLSIKKLKKYSSWIIKQNLKNKDRLRDYEKVSEKFLCLI